MHERIATHRRHMHTYRNATGLYVTQPQSTMAFLLDFLGSIQL